MPMKKSVPALNPDAYVASLDGWHQRYVQALREAVLETGGLTEAIKWGHLVYFSNGPVLLIRAEDKRVLFAFWRGQRLQAIEPRLKSGGQYEMATLELMQDTPLERAKVVSLVEQAVALNATLGDPTDVPNMKPAPTDSAPSPSELIDARIAALGDWRGEMLARLRALIKQADPEVIEEWKWRGTPVWSHDGILCTGETYKSVVKMTFAKGASLPDPNGLFNSSLEGNVRRAIDVHEGDTLNEGALTMLIQAAVAANESSARRRSSKP